jgi:hypothetical protein
MLKYKVCQKEGVIYKKDKYIFTIFIATFLGESSGLYD